MTKSEIESHISNLHAHLKTADLSEADRVSLRNEIGHWQDTLALLEFRNENSDIDYGYHDQFDFWGENRPPISAKPLMVSNLHHKITEKRIWQS